MGTVDFQTQNTFDRRIGRRLVLDGIDVIDVTWMVPQHGRFGRAKPPQELAGSIENVSITGAAIVGPSELALSAGDEAVVRCEGRDSIVSVRHAQPCGDDRTTRYGVEITSVAPNLKRRIQALLDPTLARLPAEAPAPGRLSLRGGVARPTLAAQPVVPAAEAAPAEVPEPVALVEPTGGDAKTPEPTAAEPAPDHHVVLDLTDTTMAAEGGAAVLDLTEPAPDAAPAPIPAPVMAVEAEPVIEPDAVLEPEPVIEAEEPVEPDAPAARVIDPQVPVAHAAHLPPVEMSEGRRVLDEVFGLMED